MSADDAYERVNTAWPNPVPPCTRDEAVVAAVRLMRKFGGKVLPVRVRRCWVSPKESSSLDKGWPRLVHDLSHRVYRMQYHRGVFATHSRTHAELEAAMAQWVVGRGYLEGRLKPKVRPKVAALVRVQAGIQRWEAKLRRAENALRRLRKREKYYQRKEK